MDLDNVHPIFKKYFVNQGYGLHSITVDKYPYLWITDKGIQIGVKKLDNRFHCASIRIQRIVLDSIILNEGNPLSYSMIKIEPIVSTSYDKLDYNLKLFQQLIAFFNLHTNKIVINIYPMDILSRFSEYSGKNIYYQINLILPPEPEETEKLLELMITSFLNCSDDDRKIYK